MKIQPTPTHSPDSAPVFRLQIVHADGSGVQFDGGGPFERDLIAACRDEILACFVQTDEKQHASRDIKLITACRDEILSRGVGFWRTEKHVSQDIEEGIKAALMSLKRETLRIV